jgi:ribosome-binding protein aMBF1 (putative translation factor)
MPGRLHDPSYAAFVRCLVEARHTNGVSQVDLAARLKRPQSYISKLERLERRLDVEEWRAIAAALGIDPTVAFAEVCASLARNN